MKIHKFQNKEEWLNFRKGKISGSRLKDIVTSGITKDIIVKELESQKIDFKKTAKKEELQSLLSKEVIAKLESKLDKKIGFYELIAERLAVSEEEFDGYIPNETPMDRGTRLEKLAIERFKQETLKEVSGDLIIWSSDENDDITVSPDGVVSEEEAIEVKCLSSAKHIEAFLTQKIPDEYMYQRLQYFIVNDKLQKLNFAFYDPRIPAKDFFIIEVLRKDIEQEIEQYREYQIRVIAEVNQIVNNLLNF